MTRNEMLMPITEAPMTSRSSQAPRNQARFTHTPSVSLSPSEAEKYPSCHGSSAVPG